ncbi:TPA: fimbrial biogenesis usher protein [Klebsiella quasipneumoniae subsp. similipneumoniae]
MSQRINGASHPGEINKMYFYKSSGRHITRLSFALLVAIQIFSARAELYFNPRFLSDDPSTVADLSAFENGQEVLPGTYRVDIYLNDSWMATRDVNFQVTKESSDLQPCLTRSQLSAMGVNTMVIAGMSVLSAKACVPLTEMIKESTTKFDVGLQRLYVTVPQIYMGNNGRGYIPPELWDQGINSGILNYSLTGNSVRSGNSGTQNYMYLNLQSGANVGAWRLRDNTTWSYSGGSSTASSRNKWQHVNTWLERDIIALRSRLSLGDSYTNGDIFDGVNFRGAQLSSEENMLPDSQRGYAPVIHGIARGTAQVSVKQNGYVIYQNTVPPGPFTINDLYAAGNAGDLQVTITEADGSARVMTIPYASVPFLQREGYTRYAMTAGEYRTGSTQQDKPKFFQGTILRGLPGNWTVFGGTQIANRYRAFNIGIGRNMGIFGALSLDATHANSKLADDKNYHGQSLRFLYNKSLSDTGTNIQLVGYRYSTKGYFGLADTAYKRMQGYNIETEDGLINVKPKFMDYYNLAYSKRGKVQLSVSQQIGTSSSLYVSGSHQTYWGTSRADKQLQIGLNSSIEDINWSLSYTLAKNAWQESNDQMLALNMNIPFSHWMRSDSKSVWRNSSASYAMSNDMKGRMSNLAGLYGTLLEDNNLSYSVQTGYTGGGSGRSGESGYTSLNYRGGYGNANLGYSHTTGSNQFYYGLSGGVLAHTNGITLSQPMNDTIVLVKAPGAKDVKIENQTGVRTDWRGYAVLPYATEYRENRISLDTNTLAHNVELEDSVVSVVPTRGAVVRAEFQPQIGLKVLMVITYNGKPVPFGAVAIPENSKGGSIVADNGQVYLSGLPLAGKVNVKWGESHDANCIVNYRLPAGSQNQLLSHLTAICQ